MQGILAGRYRLERQLGKGGMGSVWLAEHLSLSSWVAVKLMDPSIAATAEGAERFRREAQAAASLRSAHVVQVLDYGVHESTPFLVMELLQGESLADCLAREKRLTPERTLQIVTHVARAIGRAHAGGIVHRDLKPDNVFLVREDDQELAKVLDFGIAKTSGARFGGMETRTGVTMGTPYYMSPEQAEGKKAVDHRSDLWSLAVIACECVTGVRPFDGETFGELLLNICARPVQAPSSLGFRLPGFDEWFARATDRNPERRFGSAQELAAALGDVVSGRGLSGARPAVSTAGPVEVSLPMNRPNAVPLIALGALALLAGAAFAWFGLLHGKPVAQAAAPELSAPVAPAAPASSVVAQEPTASSVATPPALVPSVTAAATKAAQRPAKPGQPASNAEPEANAAGEPSAPSNANPPAPASGASKGARTERCFADPFTGQIRLARGGDANTFACKQNPFTGAYQRQ